jgi:hypothetical protein
MVGMFVHKLANCSLFIFSKTRDTVAYCILWVLTFISGI